MEILYVIIVLLPKTKIGNNLYVITPKSSHEFIFIVFISSRNTINICILKIITIWNELGFEQSKLVTNK